MSLRLRVRHRNAFAADLDILGAPSRRPQSRHRDECPIVAAMALHSRPRPPRRSKWLRLELALAIGMALAFLVWTWLVLHGRLHGLDTRMHPPYLPPRSFRGQLAEAVSLITHPALVLLAVTGSALLSFQQRMRRLTLALTIGALGIAGELGLSLALDVPRPPTAFMDSISHIGGAYPASHVTAITLGAWVMVTLTRAHRKRATSVLRWVTIGSATVLLTAVAQWSMGLVHVSDVVGGLLLGGAVANLALTAGGVDPILAGWAHLGLPERTVDKHAAIIYNPTKFDDLSLLRRRVEAEVLDAGWQPVRWLETSPDDPGHAAARQALEAEVDLVMAAGGDGTVRAVCAELAGTSTPVALVPSGTGNLLARNLNIPLDTDEALRLALGGPTTTIDVVRCTWDGGEERFVVMAGLGLDAQIMDDTHDGLKKVIRTGAYAVAAMQNAVPDPFTLTVAVEEDEPFEQQAVMALLGNVGSITAGMNLFPDASPSDGAVDLMVASPERITDWAKLGAQILTGKEMEGFSTHQGRRIRLTADEPVPFELDGDMVGQTRSLEVEVEPAALNVVVPDQD